MIIPDEHQRTIASHQFAQLFGFFLQNFLEDRSIVVLGDARIIPLLYKSGLTGIPVVIDPWWIVKSRLNIVPTTRLNKLFDYVSLATFVGAGLDTVVRSLCGPQAEALFVPSS